MLQIVGRMRNNLSTSESDSNLEFLFSFILLAWITTKGDSGFMKRLKKDPCFGRQDS